MRDHPLTKAKESISEQGEPDSLPEPVRAELRAPDEWADALFPVDRKGRRPSDYWRHAAAAALHGWGAHAHHEGAAMSLSRDDYEAALAAADKPADARGNYRPHAGATSRHLPKSERS